MRGTDCRVRAGTGSEAAAIDPLFPQPPSPYWGDEGFDPSLLSHLRAKLGDQAEEAIGEAIARADERAAVWEVEIDGYLPGATNALVLTCHRGNLEFVLKVPVTEWAIEDHLPALFAFCEQGGIEVFESDLESGAALLPRLRPGTNLAEVAEEEAVEVCAELVLKLRSTTGDGQPTFAFETLSASLRPSLAEEATEWARWLRETATESKILHGDLHHFNVLQDGNRWVAIDPEGMGGDPAYEWAAFMRNPVPQMAEDPELIQRLRRRILRFSDLSGDPAERIWGWSLVRTIQCVAWSEVSPFHASWTKVVQALDELRFEFKV